MTGCILLGESFGDAVDKLACGGMIDEDLSMDVEKPKLKKVSG